MAKYRRILWVAVRLLFVIVILAFIVSRVDLRSFFMQAQQLNVGYLADGFLFTLISLVIVSMRWKFIVDVIAPNTSLVSLFAFNLVGVFYSQFLPGSMAADLVKGYYLARTQNEKGSIFSSVVMDRFIGILMNGFLGIVALLSNQIILRALKIDYRIPLVALGIMVVGLVFAYLSLVYLETAESRFPAPVVSFVRSIRLYLRHPVALTKAIMANFAYFTVWCLGFWYLMQSVGLTQLDYLTALLALAAVSFTQVMPISINGWGVRESALILLLGVYGVASERALLFSLLVAAVNIVVAVLGGILVLTDYRYIKVQPPAL